MVRDHNEQLKGPEYASATDLRLRELNASEAIVENVVSFAAARAALSEVQRQPDYPTPEVSPDVSEAAPAEPENNVVELRPSDAQTMAEAAREVIDKLNAAA